VSALYNEWEGYPAAWLRNLIAAGHVAPGRVDERSIVELTADDLVGVVQFHAFAGVGIWSHALRLVGWADNCPAWTVSCPCQPFSAAGLRRGTDDERHLWPVYFDLVRQCRPPVVLGEQVSSPDGRAWFDAVSADLEGAGYAVGALNTCAAGVGAPHIRQRLYFVALADADGAGLAGWPVDGGARGHGGPATERGGGGGAERMGHTDCLDSGRDGGAAPRQEAEGCGVRMLDGHLGDEPRVPSAGGGGRNPWAAVDWLACSDGKLRPAQPGVRPLAPSTAAGMGQVRAYGNGLCAEQAATFIEAVMDLLELPRAA
jgi:DNA (cytosine-5)-methyltransferase 1